MKLACQIAFVILLDNFWWAKMYLPLNVYCLMYVQYINQHFVHYEGSCTTSGQNAINITSDLFSNVANYVFSCLDRGVEVGMEPHS